MPVRIYFCGEVVADFHESVPKSNKFDLLLGGSQFHGACGATHAVKRESLNYTIGFVGPMSLDTFGERFFERLTELNVDTSGVKRVDRNTTLAIVTIKTDTENAFSFYGRDTAEQMTKIEDLPTSLGKEGDQTICCFGSISTVMEPARFAWLEFAQRQKGKALLFYDLNTRPAIAKDRERYRSIVLEWAKTVDIVKASDADIGWAYPNTPMADVAKIWLDAGAKLAVFTKGPKGSEIYTRTVSARADSLNLDTTHTVGAGDNFNAGLAINFAKANVFKVEDIETLTEDQLATILKGANLIAAKHLLNIGAQQKPILVQPGRPNVA